MIDYQRLFTINNIQVSHSIDFTDNELIRINSIVKIGLHYIKKAFILINKKILITEIMVWGSFKTREEICISKINSLIWRELSKEFELWY